MVMSWCPLKKTAIRLQNAGVFVGNININIKSLRLSEIPLTLTPLIILSEARERPPLTCQSRVRVGELALRL